MVFVHSKYFHGVLVTSVIMYLVFTKSTKGIKHKISNRVFPLLPRVFPLHWRMHKNKQKLKKDKPQTVTGAKGRRPAIWRLLVGKDVCLSDLADPEIQSKNPQTRAVWRVTEQTEITWSEGLGSPGEKQLPEPGACEVGE